MLVEGKKRLGLDLFRLMRREMLKVFTKNSCIAATSVLCQLLERCGYMPRPLAVSCTVLAPASAEHFKEHGVPLLREDYGGPARADNYAIGCHEPFGAFAEGGWNGHLVALSGDLLVDMSVDQYSRPQHGIVIDDPIMLIEPRLEEVVKESVATGRGICVPVERSLVIYRPRPECATFKGAPDWRPASGPGHALQAGLVKDAWEYLGRGSPTLAKRDRKWR